MKKIKCISYLLIAFFFYKKQMLHNFLKKSDLEGTRTPNPLIRSQKLYPLSHETTCNFK